jgi:hypothetical protein
METIDVKNVSSVYFVLLLAGKIAKYLDNRHKKFYKTG